MLFSDDDSLDSFYFPSAQCLLSRAYLKINLKYFGI